MPGVEAAEGEQQGRQWLGWAVLFVPITALFAWWGLDAGAYFGVVFYPGEIGLLALLAVLLFSVPLRTRLHGAPLVALLALLGLAAWVLLSIFWTPTPEVAVGDTHRLLLYAALFVLGIWIVGLLGERHDLALAPVAIAGVVVGVVTVITLGHGTNFDLYLHDDATLRFPIGYRNANAAFWLICAWPLLALAVRSRLPWPLRALMVGATTMLLELTVLSQSRGSLPAAAVALIVLIGFSRRGLKIALFAALAAIPMIPAVPTLLHVFQHGAANPGAIPLLHDAAGAIAISSLASVALAALYLGLFEPRISIAESTVSVLSRVTAALAILVVLAGGALFVSSHGGPTGFVNQRLEELREGTPDLRDQGARFGVNVGSNRGDLSGSPSMSGRATRSAAAALAPGRSNTCARSTTRRPPARPAQRRDADALRVRPARDPPFRHLRDRRGRGGNPLRGGSTPRRDPRRRRASRAAQWLIQASYDWMLFYPAVTAPTIFLLGAADGTRAQPRARQRLAPAPRLSRWRRLASSLSPPMASPGRSLHRPRRRRVRTDLAAASATSTTPALHRPLRGRTTDLQGRDRRAHPAMKRLRLRLARSDRPRTGKLPGPLPPRTDPGRIQARYRGAGTADCSASRRNSRCRSARAIPSSAGPKPSSSQSCLLSSWEMKMSATRAPIRATKGPGQRLAAGVAAPRSCARPAVSSRPGRRRRSSGTARGRRCRARRGRRGRCCGRPWGVLR